MCPAVSSGSFGSDTVQVYRSGSRWQTDMVASLLDGHGVDVVLSGVGIDHYTQLFDGYRIYVRSEDEQRARELIRAAEAGELEQEFDDRFDW